MPRSLRMNSSSIARELDNPDLLLEAYHAKIPMQVRLADFSGIAETAEEVIRLYDRKRHRDHAYYFGGHDSRMCARGFYAFGLWGQGLLDQAQRMAWQAVEDARELGHALSLAHALQRTGMIMTLLRDVESCRIVADELYPLAERNKFPWQLADAIFLRGWLAALAGDYDAGIEQMLHAINQPFSAGFRPIFLPVLPSKSCARDMPIAAMATIERATVEAGEQANQFCEPDIVRCRGEILLLQSRENGGAAERTFREALAMAAAQSCRPLELRTAMSLAKLLAENGRRNEAHDLLAPVYGALHRGIRQAGSAGGQDAAVRSWLKRPQKRKRPRARARVHPASPISPWPLWR